MRYWPSLSVAVPSAARYGLGVPENPVNGNGSLTTSPRLSVSYPMISATCPGTPSWANPPGLIAAMTGLPASISRLTSARVSALYLLRADRLPVQGSLSPLDLHCGVRVRLDAAMAYRVMEERRFS